MEKSEILEVGFNHLKIARDDLHNLRVSWQFFSSGCNDFAKNSSIKNSMNDSKLYPTYDYLLNRLIFDCIHAIFRMTDGPSSQGDKVSLSSIRQHLSEKLLLAYKYNYIPLADDIEEARKKITLVLSSQSVKSIRKKRNQELGHSLIKKTPDIHYQELIDINEQLHSLFEELCPLFGCKKNYLYIHSKKIEQNIPEFWSFLEDKSIQ